MASNDAAKKMLGLTASGIVEFRYPESFPAQWEDIHSRHGARPAIRWKDSTLTYEQLGTEVQALRALLRTRLETSGSDTVAMIGDHPFYLIAIQIAALCEGCAFAYLGKTVGEVEWGALPFEPGLLIDCRSSGDTPGSMDAVPCDVMVYQNLDRNSSGEAVPPPTGNQSHGGAIFMTSGSTGRSLAVKLSVEALMQDIARQTRTLCLTREDRLDLLFSMSFSASLAPIFGALLNGALLCVYDWSGQRGMDLMDWLNRERITISTMTPSMLQSVVHAPTVAEGLPSLRLLSLGGEAMHRSLLETLRVRLNDRCVIQLAYASTETRTVCEYLLPVRDDLPTGLISVGWPVEGKEVGFMVDGRCVTQADQQGEIVVKSRYIATGYLGQVGSDRFSTCPDTGAIVFRTGDVGYFDASGALILEGRVDDLVKVRGQRISLKAVEREACRLHPAWLYKAFHHNGQLVLCVESGKDPLALAQRHFESMRPNLKPHVIEFFPEFPKTHTGKVDGRTLMRWWEQEKQLPYTNTTSSSVRQSVERILGSVLGRSGIAPSAHFQKDMGMDSLQYTELHARLEVLMRALLPRDMLDAYPTLESLCRFLDRSSFEPQQRIMWTRHPDVHHDTQALVVEITRDAYRHSILDGLKSMETEGVSLAGLHYSFAPELGQHQHRTMKTIGRDCAAMVGAVDRSVPVILVGYSLAGLVVFETACALQAQGFQVPVITLIGTHTYRRKSRWRTLKDDLLHGARWRKLFSHYARPDRLKLFFRKLGARYGLARYGASSAVPQAQDRDRLPMNLRFDASIGYALSNYRPSRFSGDLLLFREAEEQGGAPSNFCSDFHWQPHVSGKVHQELIHGSHHLTMMTQHHDHISKVLCSVLKDSMEHRCVSL